LLLFTVGINTALRISDLLTVQLGQVVDASHELRDTFTIREEKRNKRNVVTINASIEQALESYLAVYPKILPNPTTTCSSRRVA